MCVCPAFSPRKTAFNINVKLQRYSVFRQAKSGISLTKAAIGDSRSGEGVKIMKMLSKAALFATVGAVLMTAAPAQARHGDWGRGWDRGHDRIDAGDVIAGALIIGGIAAIASATSRNDGYRGDGYRGGGYYDDRDDRYDRDNRGGYGSYNNGYGSRYAVDQCIRAAQREASRYGNARITDVTTINRTYGGYEVRGRLVVQNRGYQSSYGGYDRGYYYDRYDDNYDKGKFTCVTQNDRVVDVRLGGLNRY
jgi:hypothetical protein